MTHRRVFTILLAVLLAYLLAVCFGSLRRAGAQNLIDGSQIAQNTIAPSQLSATSGTPNSTTYYRGDGTWQSVTSGYTLPIASASVLGGVKIGSGIIEGADGTISVTPGSSGSFVPGPATAPSFSLYAGFYLGTTEYVAAHASWITNSGGLSVPLEGGGALYYQTSTTGSSYTGPDGTSSTYYVAKGSDWIASVGITSGTIYVKAFDVNASGSLSSGVTASTPYAAPPLVYTASAPITLTGSAISLATLGTSGTYAYPASVTLDAYGRISSITAGSAPATYTASSPITLTGSAFGLATSGVTAGSYGFGHSATYDQYGRAMAAANPTGTASSSTYLRGDGTWATPGGGTSYTFTLPLVNSSGTVSASVMGASGTGHSAGIVPDPGATAGTSHFLREDGTWQIPSAGGSTVGFYSADPSSPTAGTPWYNYSTHQFKEQETGKLYATLMLADFKPIPGSIVNTSLGISSGLVLSYNMNEGSGTTLTDQSTSAENATLSSSTMWATDSTYQTATTYSGSNWAYFPYKAALNIETYTVEVTFKTTSTNTQILYYWGPYGNASPNYTAFSCQLGVLSTGKAFLQFVDTTGSAVTISSSSTYNDGNWHKMIGVRTKSGSCALYVDSATAVATGTDTLGSTTVSGIGDGRIGGRPSQTTGYPGTENLGFTGFIGNEQVWNRALTSSEITSEINDPFDPYR